MDRRTARRQTCPPHRTGTPPAATRLAAITGAAAGGGEPAGYDRARSRWRLGNVILTVLYLTLLALIVFRNQG